MGQINTNNYPIVDSLADADLLIVENAIHGTGTTTPKQLKEKAIGTDPLETTAQTVTGAINELKNEMSSAGHTLAGVGHKTAYDSAAYTIDSDIILHRAPKGMDRVLLFLDEKVTRPLNLTIYGESYSDEYTVPVSIGGSVWEPPAYMDGICILEYHEFEEEFVLIAMYEAVTGSNGVVPISKGGTGNSYGYIRTGRATGSNVGYGATIEGANNTASNSYAHAGGQNVVADGTHSFAHGQYVNAGYAQQTAFGRYNDNKAANLFEVGNGTADNARSNAMEVTANGNVVAGNDIVDGNGYTLSTIVDVISTEKTVSGNPITVTDALPYPAVSLSASIEPIQDLHGYDHPWVGGAGKNKLKPFINSGLLNGVTWTLNSDGTATSSGKATSNPSQLLSERFILPLGNYFLSGCPTGGDGETYYLRVIGYDSSNNIVLNRTDVGSGVTFTVDETVEDLLVFVSVYTGTTAPSGTWKPMIESGSSGTSYAPYSNICPISGRTSVTITDYDSESNTATVTVQLGQTVYGGSLNLTTGELMVTDAIKTIDDYTIKNGDGSGGGLSWYDVDADYGNSDLISSHLVSKAGSYGWDSTTDCVSAAVRSGNIKCIRIYSSCSTIEELKTKYTGLQVCYKLATPTTIQLTPEQLTMLKGYNRLSSDGGGNITLTYKADRLAAIEAALAAL